MTGITERIEAKLDQVLALLSNHVGAQPVQPVAPAQPSMGLPTQQPVQPPITPPPAQPDPLAFTPPVQPQVTNDMITTLIQPHIGNPAIKAAMQGVLQQLNIPGLPQAREDQYPVLYQHFQTIIAQHTAQPPAQAGNPGASPLNSGGVSIL